MAKNTKTYTVTNTDLVGGTTMTQVMTDGGINIHSIRVAFHSSDLLIDPILASTLAPATSKSAAAASTSIPTTAAMPKSSLSATPTASSAGDLSMEATAGIGVGVGIGISFCFPASYGWYGNGITLNGKQWKAREKLICRP
ncbi:hypothetical protein F4821DRAFT_277966 [Hypoxylon rubiginosum]|uniref:Uncharacterized protein n=1 Tax=Hypoxylon rubiginosum TaxID=110542 RepID=A0ACC0DJK1_9PEZI|nr:hypothetical protein F4821DRAFT_277966 [Hypoxylon rubiginosum]